MTPAGSEASAERLGGLVDPCIDRTKHHSLTDIPTIALCSATAGADSWVGAETSGSRKEERLREML